MIKKITFITVSGLLGALTFPAPTLAATTISLSPSSVNVVQGKSFNMTIGINPQDIKNYTAKIQIQYPAELLEVESFTFKNSWMALSQPGYDLIDNTKGVLVKTAGFTGGFSSPVTFGAVSFLAKKSGDGIVKIGPDSIMLDRTSQNVFKDTAIQSSIKITVLSPPAEQSIPSEEEIPVTPAEEATPTALFDISIQPDIKPSNGKLLTTILAGIGIFVLIIASYALYRKRKKKRL